MTVQTLLISWHTLKLTEVTVLAFNNCGSICAVLHVFMSCRSMAGYTLLSFMGMLAVVKFNGFLFECVPKLENVFMTGQAPF